MNTKLYGALFVALVVASAAATDSEKKYIEFSDLAQGKVQIIGILGVPIGRVVRVEATVVSAEKIVPDFTPYREMYMLSIHTIDGRKVTDLFTNFSVNRFAVSKLFHTRSELTEKLQDIYKHTPTDEEINKAERELFSKEKRTYLVYECISFFGMPAEMPPDVVLWSGHFPFGPDSRVDVIKELETTK